MKAMEHKQSELFYRQLSERLDLDVLFECLAVMISGAGSYDLDRIQVIPSDNHRRNYRNDLIAMPSEGGAEHFFQTTEDGFLKMYTSRSAILNYLPEDFYAQPDNSHEYYDEFGKPRKGRDLENYRREVSMQQRDAERFFRPIEVACNGIRLQREAREVSDMTNQDDLFHNLWSAYKLVDNQWRRFVRTRHLVSHVVGDLDKTRALISYVLGLPVRLSLSVESSAMHSPEDIQAVTGTQRTLGYNVVFGNTIFDYLEVCTMTLEDLSTSEFYDFYNEDGQGHRLLAELVKHYFPLNVEVKFDYGINPDRDGSDSKALPVVGYSTTLGADITN